MALPINAMTPRARRCVIRAGAAADEHGQAFIGTEHLLLAIVEDADGIGGQVLNRLGVSGALKDELETIIAGYGSGGGPTDPGDEVRVRFESAALSNHPIVVIR
jgi:ATP-dependent Clp protease ATP-binding subunit ClpA